MLLFYLKNKDTICWFIGRTVRLPDADRAPPAGLASVCCNTSKVKEKTASWIFPPGEFAVMHTKTFLSRVRPSFLISLLPSFQKWGAKIPQAALHLRNTTMHSLILVCARCPITYDNICTPSGCSRPHWQETWGGGGSQVIAEKKEWNGRDQDHYKRGNLGTKAS